MKHTPVWFLAAGLATAATLLGCSAPTPSSSDTSTEASNVTVKDVTIEAAVGKADGPYEMPPVDEATADEVDALISEAEGKVLVLNLWATWCPPCVAEMPYFSTFYETMDREKTAFLSVSADDLSTKEDAVLPFMKDLRIPFPVYLLDSRDPDDFATALRTEISGGLPTTIFYDKSGNVAKVVERDMNLEEIREIVVELGGA